MHEKLLPAAAATAAKVVKVQQWQAGQGVVGSREE